MKICGKQLLLCDGLLTWTKGVGNTSVSPEKKSFLRRFLKLQKFLQNYEYLVSFNAVYFVYREQFTKKIQEQENLGKV